MTSKLVADLNPQTLSCCASAITNNSHLTAVEECGLAHWIFFNGEFTGKKVFFLFGFLSFFFTEGV